MFKWIISLILILISLPIIYFNIVSFYQTKRQFQHSQQLQEARKFNVEKTTNSTGEINLTKEKEYKTKHIKSNFSNFDDEFNYLKNEFAKDWNNF